MEASGRVAFDSFCEKYGDEYNKAVEELRKDISRLQNQVYLDFAGAVPYSDSQLNAVFDRLKDTLHINPHSAAGGESDIIGKGRQLTRALCNASDDEYDVIFTSGATEAIRMVGDAFPWKPGSTFAYTQDNHTSIVGLRETAMAHGGVAVAGTLQHTDQGVWQLNASNHSMHRLSTEPSKSTPSLFAFPHESNFDGARYDLNIGTDISDGKFSIKYYAPNSTPGNIPGYQVNGLKSNESGEGCVRTRRWYVLLDAAKSCASCPPDLGKYSVDFVVLSFYKIFGYPTGLGALVVKREAMKIMRQGYFGGGTVEVAVPDMDTVHRRPNASGWQHGTPNFLALSALPAGFERIEALGGYKAIDRHATCLTKWLKNELGSLKHYNGGSVCCMYNADNEADIQHGNSCEFSGSWWRSEGGGIAGCGPIVTFNLKRPDGGWVGYSEVSSLAALHNIHLRTGCFCNPGACALALGLTSEQIILHYKLGHICGDNRDIINGSPTGAIRVSLGYSSTFSDVLAFLNFIKQSFVQHTPPSPGPMLTQSTGRGQVGTLKEIWVYPVKSCGGQCVSCWPVSQEGLLYDRHWAVVDVTGRVMTLGKYPQMSLIQARVDLTAGWLTLSHKTHPKSIRLKLPTGRVNRSHNPEHTVKVCGRTVDCRDVTTVDSGHDSEAGDWLSQVLGVQCKLVECVGSLKSSPTQGQDATSSHDSSNDPKSNKHSNSQDNFSNENNLLVLSTSSMDHLHRQMHAKEYSIHIDSRRFRPNLLIDTPGHPAHCEDHWGPFKVGSSEFRVLKQCMRCDAIMVDSEKGIKDRKEPLLTLTTYRRGTSRVVFGVLCACTMGDRLSLGDSVVLMHSNE